MPECERESVLITSGERPRILEKRRWSKHTGRWDAWRLKGYQEGWSSQRNVSSGFQSSKPFKSWTLNKIPKVPASLSMSFAGFVILTPTVAARAWCLTNPWCFFLLQPEDHIWFGAFITCSREMIQALDWAPWSSQAALKATQQTLYLGGDCTYTLSRTQKEAVIQDHWNSSRAHWSTQYKG